MARRAKEQGDILSLFPFLSILTCLIGTLTMLIALLAMQQVNKTEVDAAKIKASEQERISAETRLRDYKALKDKIQKDKLSISAVKKLLKELEDKRKTLLEELERLIKEKALRVNEIAKRNKAASKAEELMGELNRSKDKIAKVTAEMDRVKKEIAEKTAVLSTKTKKSVSTVMVRPAGSQEGAEWVNAPTEMAFTPVCAISRMVFNVTPPEASVLQMPEQSFTHSRNSSSDILSSSTQSGFAGRIAFN